MGYYVIIQKIRISEMALLLTGGWFNYYNSERLVLELPCNSVGYGVEAQREGTMV